MPNQHILAKALHLIFKRDGINPALRIVDYGDEDTFASLWLSGMRETSYQSVTHLLLCNAHPPQQAFAFLNQPGMPPSEMAGHYSAYSWAAAFRLINPKTALSIVIVESSPHSPSCGAAADLCNIFEKNQVCGVHSLRFPNLHEIAEALSPKSVPELVSREKGILRGIIHQHLLPNPEDHHKLGNIVGALMLSPQPESRRGILGALFHALEPDTNFQIDVKMPDVDPGLCKRITYRQLPFVLFDDMSELWRPFLQRWTVGNKLYTPVVSEDSRAKLIEKLRKLATQPVQRRYLCASDFGVDPNKVADGSPFVLMLDLRLFAGNQRDKEALFVADLVSAAKAVSQAKDLKWPRMSQEEIDQSGALWTRAFDGDQVFSPAYRKVRSWLPRLISSCDPTLPIVIFSSTGDPAVFRAFQGYGNVVTDFSKPVFRGAMGEANEWTDAACLGFEGALRTALNIATARQKIHAVCPLVEIVNGDRDHEKIDKQQYVAPKRIEIFIDESGTASQERFALGAVVLISGGAAFDHSAYRKSAMEKNEKGQILGLWGLDDEEKFKRMRDLPHRNLWLKKGGGKGGVQTGKDGHPVAHNVLLDQKLIQMEALVTVQDARLFACSLLSTETPIPNDISSLRHPFHRYRDMLTRLLEAIFFHFEPVVSAIKANAEICVDAAIAKNDANSWNLKDLRESFGAEYFTETEKIQTPSGEREVETDWCRTMARSHVLPLVAGLLVRYARDSDLTNRQAKERAKKLVRARALQLTNFSECTQNTLSREDRPDPKPLHHLADWIAHFTWDLKDWNEVDQIPTLNKWFSMGFRQEDTEEFKAQLRSHRRWSQGQRIDAIRGWKEAQAMDNFGLTSRLGKAAEAWMSDITGDDLTQLFHLGDT